MSEKPKPQNNNTETGSLLDRVHLPEDMRNFEDSALKDLATELREATIEAVSQTGGHLGAGLGVVELTVAIHSVFNTPYDRLIWDVGHQCYPHKILTGRKDRIHTLRQGDGLSGFTKRSESEYDPFGAAHSSTSISAGLGMATAAHLSGDERNVICVIGDGAMSAGMAYEALNNAGILCKDFDASKLIVILNDNEMSIAPPVGAMSKYLTNLVSSTSYRGARSAAKQMTQFLPEPMKKAARRAEETARVALGGGTMFEEMGFYYIGPVDGHDLNQLLPILRNVQKSDQKGPILIHAITQKGKGYLPAETSKDKMHGVKKFDVITGEQQKSKINIPSYTKVFAQELIKQAKDDDKIVGITAAMPDGTGMDLFGYEFPERTFDVGIAEQHGVTFAAGLAAEGYKPFAAIYSTFLQRAYDQVVHDVAIQNLPVRFAIDRAGLVGADGQTHAGSFDIAYLGCLPNFVLMAAADEAELCHMVATAVAHDSGPIAFRYPRGNGVGVDLRETSEVLEIGKGRIVHGDRKKKADIALLSYGGRLQECLKAAKLLEEKGKTVTVADARFAKPLDEDLISDLTQNHDQVITIEEAAIGGFGSFVLEYLARTNQLQSCKVKTMHLPDIFQDQDDPDSQYKQAGLDAQAIVKTAIS